MIKTNPFYRQTLDILLQIRISPDQRQWLMEEAERHAKTGSTSTDSMSDVVRLALCAYADMAPEDRDKIGVKD